MSDHKFEKQVRQKLSDLKLTPTPESWEKIENEIRERKRRAAPIFWLPLLLLGLGAGGYFILKPSFKGSTLAVNETPAVAKTDKITIPGEKIIAPQEKTTEPVKNTEPVIIKETVPQIQNRNTDKRNTDKLNSSHSNVSGTVKKTSIPEEDDVAGNKEVPQNKQEDIEEDKGVDKEVAEEEKQAPEKPVAEVKPSIKETAPSQEIAKPAEQKKKNKSKKWAFGVTAFAGVSTMNEGKFGNLSGAQVEDIAARQNFAAAPPNMPSNVFYDPSTPAPVPPPPSKLYPGFSFSAGITAKRELSNRFSISAGLNYLQVNTVTKVGYKMNNQQIVNGPQGVNVVSLYYLPPQDYVNEYKNKYHFVELPVTLHTRINKSQKLPVYWNAGVSASALVGSTALHYDGARGVYYKDDALLNEFQGAVTTGFSFSLFNRSSKPLWIGPSVRYNISPALKKDVSASKNFMGLGLDMRWFLK